ncbi:MAG: peptidylprolyl isomerase [Phycisphaerales bacterium]
MRPRLLVPFLLIALSACERTASQPDAPPPAAPQPHAAAPSAPPAEAPTDETWKTPLTAVFEQPSGTIRIRLEVAEAPQLCANFVNLAQRGLFANQAWDDFSPVVRQTQAIGPGFDIGYQLPKDFSPKLLFDQGGLLCVSNVTDDPSSRTRPNRIFITVKPQDRWNLVYSVIGRIVEGQPVAQNLVQGERIRSVRIEGDTGPLLARYAKDVAAWNAAIDARLPKAARP